MRLPFANTFPNRRVISPVVVEVREASAFERLLGLLIEYERNLPERLRHGPEPDIHSVRRTYSEPNAAFISCVDDIALGCIAVTRFDEPTAIIQRLYVRPEYRGHGSARTLVAAAVDFCRKRGYRRVVLDTDRDQLPAAYSLYVSLGFTLCEPFYPVAYDNATFMELRL
jgi:putative acetyltransferase